MSSVRSAQVVEEPLQLPAERGLILDVRDVADLGEHDHPRRREPPRQIRGDARRVDQVALADQHEARDLHGADPIAAVVPGRGLRLAGERLGVLRPWVALGELDHAVDLARLPVERRGHQPGEHGPGERPGVELPSEHDPRLEHRPAPVVGPGVRRGQRQAPDHPGVPQRQLLRHQTAQRLPDHVRRRRRDRVEPAGHIVGHVGRRVRAVGPVAPPGVPRVEAQRPEPRGEMPLRPDERPVIPAQPAQEHEGLPLGPHFFVVEFAAPNDDPGHDRRSIARKRTGRRRFATRRNPVLLSVNGNPALGRAKIGPGSRRAGQEPRTIAQPLEIQSLTRLSAASRGKPDKRLDRGPDGVRY